MKGLLLVVLVVVLVGIFHTTDADRSSAVADSTSTVLTTPKSASVRVLDPPKELAQIRVVEHPVAVVAPYDLIKDPYSNKDRIIELAVHRYLVFMRGNLQGYNDGVAYVYVVNGFSPFRFKRMIAERQALYDVNSFDYAGNPPMEFAGQIVVSIPADLTLPLDTSLSWVVKVQGTVEGQNAFGALLQVPYVAFVRYKQAGDEKTKVELTQTPGCNPTSNHIIHVDGVEVLVACPEVKGVDQQRKRDNLLPESGDHSETATDAVQKNAVPSQQVTEIQNDKLKESVFRPSFNCAMARNPVELLICGDRYLASTEVGMVSAYNLALARVPDDRRNTLKQQHLAWFRNYSRTCNRADNDTDRTACVASFLSARTTDLNNLR